MAIQVQGFGPPITAAQATPGTYFTAFGYKWRGLCLAVENQGEPLCLVLDYEGDMGDQFPTPRQINISALGSQIAAVPADQLVIRPRSESGTRPFMAPADSSGTNHGALVILASGEPVIAQRSHGYGNWSLVSGKSVDSITGGIAYSEWEIAIAEPARIHSALVRFPEEEN